MTAVVGGDSPNRSTLDTQAQAAKNKKFVFSQVEDNILKEYSNLSYLWTFAPLTPQQLALINQNGNTNNIQLSEIVIASAGRFEDKRAATFYGTPEYYIDNVDIFTLATPTRISGLSGNATINFDVFEPYSLGLFLQSCQAAAQRSGYSTYIEASWLLKLEFVGYRDNKQEKIQGATREYPLKLQQISFTANEGGSKYQVKCIDFSLEGFNNVFGVYPGSTTITASTVGEALKQLETTLNKDQKGAVDSGTVRIADKYEILIFKDEKIFPKVDIEKEKFVAAEEQSGAQGKTETKKAGTGTRTNQPKPGERSFTFSKQNQGGLRITDMISEIVKTSEYCTNALKEESVNKETGFVNWYRVSVKTEFLDGKYQLDPVTNRPAYKITYLVHPYSVHHSNFKIPWSPTLGMNTLKSLVKKKYNYLYTGENDDILKWELKFDNTFYTAIAAQGFTGGRAEALAKGSTIKETPGKQNDTGGGALGAYQITHAGRLLRSSESYRASYSGTLDDHSIRVARAFEEAMLLDTESIMLDLTVLGDPYYLTRSGAFVDRVVPNAAGEQSNNDLTMATEYGEVRIYIRFKSPIDAPVLPKTLYEFPAAGTIDSPYSGLYRIRSVKSKFNDGLFTQELNLFRDRGQQSDELQNLRRDPNILIATAPSTDLRQGDISFAPPPASSGPPPPSDALNEAKRATIETGSPLVQTSQVFAIPPQPELEITRIGPAPRSETGGPFNKVGPTGEKIPWSQEAEDQLKAQDKE